MTYSILTPPTFRYIDQTEFGNVFSAMQSFAVDDALCISVGQDYSSPTARFWVHDQTIVLGIQDVRLPYIKDAVTWLKQQGYEVLVRNSGGLAVLLDKGVLNLSLIFSNSKQLGIHEGYQAMVEFIELLFKDYPKKIEAYEITESYCPGTYDLSIDGKKFAGISQRRVKNGTAVQIYLCVEGDGAMRADIIRQFYQLGHRNEPQSFTYPKINPERMASLSQLLGVNLTVEDVRNQMIVMLTKLADRVESKSLQGLEVEWYQKRFDQMIKRNEKALDDLD